MLPEPTIPKRRAAASAPQPWVMTPLFCVPDEDEPRLSSSSVSGRRSARPPSRRVNPRGPAGRTKRDGLSDLPDLLTVTAQRLRLALVGSFPRHSHPRGPVGAVAAALQRRD